MLRPEHRDLPLHVITMKTKLDKRGLRRMLVTTLGRIDRATESIEYDKTDKSDFFTPEERKARTARMVADLAKFRAQLRHYNDMAKTLYG